MYSNIIIFNSLKQPVCVQKQSKIRILVFKLHKCIFGDMCRYFIEFFNLPG